jgi:transposase-like protein
MQAYCRSTILSMSKHVALSCPYCGESVELVIDEGGGNSQSYVEDCPVCCRPWQVEIARDPGEGWGATLRTSDE